MRVDEKRLRAIVREILAGLGEDEEGSGLAADALVGADLRGVSTHGVNLLRLISQRAAAGMLSLPTKVKIVKEDGATAALDGGNGLGQIAAHRALIAAVALAKRYGIGMSVLRNTNNIGALGYFTSSVASKEGVAAIAMTNGNPSVAPHGAADPFFGTNPLSISVPAGAGRSLVLDMSSSVVARGKIRLASLGGESIPTGWALDSEGLPTTDPKKALKGSLLPLGGPKGSGLAMMIDILAGLVSGSAYGRKLKSFHELEGPTGVGASFIAVDLGRFIDPALFASLIEEYTSEIKALRKQPGVNEILLPGEVESNKEAESRRLGIEIPEAVAAAIDEILRKSGSASRLSAEG